MGLRGGRVRVGADSTLNLGVVAFLVLGVERLVLVAVVVDGGVGEFLNDLGVDDTMTGRRVVVLSVGGGEGGDRNMTTGGVVRETAGDVCAGRGGGGGPAGGRGTSDLLRGAWGGAGLDFGVWYV